MKLKGVTPILNVSNIRRRLNGSQNLDGRRPGILENRPGSQLCVTAKSRSFFVRAARDRAVDRCRNSSATTKLPAAG